MAHGRGFVVRIPRARIYNVKISASLKKKISKSEKGKVETHWEKNEVMKIIWGNLIEDEMAQKKEE